MADDDIFSTNKEVKRCKCGCGEIAGASGYASPACEKKEVIEEIQKDLDFLDE